MLNVFEVAIHDTGGLSPDMVQKLALLKLVYKLTHMYYTPVFFPPIVLGDLWAQMAR